MVVGDLGMQLASMEKGERERKQKMKTEILLKTEKQAFRAREKAIIKAKTEKKPTKRNGYSIFQ